MEKRKPKWDILQDDEKQIHLQEIITFVEKEFDEKIGMVAAEKYLDFFMEMLYASFTNRVIDEAKLVLKKRMEDVEVDLDLLKEPIN